MNAFLFEHLFSILFQFPGVESPGHMVCCMFNSLRNHQIVSKAAYSFDIHTGKVQGLPKVLFHMLANTCCFSSYGCSGEMVSHCDFDLAFA